MLRSLLFAFLTALLFALSGCSNLDDAEVPSRNSFIKFYGSERNYEGVAAEVDSDGSFLIVGNAPGTTQTPPATVVIKVNDQGTKIWSSDVLIPNTSVASAKVLSDGYLLLGDSIELQANATETSEAVNTSMSIIKLGLDGQKIGGMEFYKDSTIQVNRGLTTISLHVDFHAAAAVQDASGALVVLGSFKVPTLPERVTLAGFNSTRLRPQWTKTYNLLNYDYHNVPALYLSNGNLVLGSTAVPPNISASAYTTITAVPPNFASPANYSFLGESSERSHRVNDLRPAPVGFAMIGTYAARDGSSANIFFAKTDPAGNIIKGSELYFDGETGSLENGGDISQSVSEDEGRALTATRDGGFVLAGVFNETVAKGNGGKDILLIKMDAFGTILWTKILGGNGDEVVSSVRELPNGSLLMCGTQTVSNASSIFILKTSANGDLEK